MENNSHQICNEETPTPNVCDYSCTCGAAKQIIELQKINYHWNQCYYSLLGKYKRSKDIERKYQDLKQKHSETKDMVRSFEEASYIYSKDDFDMLKDQLISYKNTLDKERDERQKLMEHNQRLEIELQKVSNEVEIFESQNDGMRKDIQLILSERNRLLQEVQKLINVSSVKNTSIISVCEESFIESLNQDDLYEKVEFSKTKSCRIDEHQNQLTISSRKTTLYTN